MMRLVLELKSMVSRLLQEQVIDTSLLTTLLVGMEQAALVIAGQGQISALQITIRNYMENLIYWKGVAVGMDCGSYISWFPSAPAEAIAQK